MKDDRTRMLFVTVRRNLSRIVGGVDLMVRVVRRLQEEGRFHGRVSCRRI